MSKQAPSKQTPTLDGVVGEFFAAVNAFERDAIMATFAAGAFVHDNRREFWGADAIRSWVAKEIVSDRVTVEVTEVIEHHALRIVRGRYDGQYDKKDLPDELVLTHYFTLSDAKITSLIIVFNRPGVLDEDHARRATR
jgi:hypothetical protein